MTHEAPEMHDTQTPATKKRRLNACFAPLPSPQRGQLDIQAFPHILDAVMDAASPDSLRALRATSREMQAEVYRRLRHIRLDVWEERQDEDVWKDLEAREELRAQAVIDWATIEEERETPAPPVRGRAKPLGLVVTGASANTDVIDYDGTICRLWHDYLQDNADWECSTLDKSHFGRGDWIEDWVDEHEHWYDAEPRLVRYVGGLDDHRRSYGPLKPNPCSVYFCDFADFLIGARKLEHYYEYELSWGGVQTWERSLVPELDVTFAVTLAHHYEEPWEWESARYYEMRSNRLTLLFMIEPSFLGQSEYSLEAFGKIVRQFVKNYLCGEDEPKATLVGYESWELNMLPDPLDRVDVWTEEDTIENRMRWWIRHCVEKYRARAVTSPAKDLENPIKLLTLAEWKAEIGDDYYALMTDPKATYCSRHPLPPLRRGT